MLSLGLCLISVTLALLYICFQRQHSYWLRHKVAFVQPLPFIGNLGKLLVLRQSFGDFFFSLHRKAIEGNHPFLGFYLFGTPALLVREPELIHDIFVRHANLFPNRYESADNEKDIHGFLTLPLAKHHLWRSSRRKLAYCFTKAMLEVNMFHKVERICEKLRQSIENQIKTNQKSQIEVKSLCNFYTLDVTSILMYSLEGSNLQESGSYLAKTIEKLFKPSLRKVFYFFIIFLLPKWASLLHVKVFPEAFLQAMHSTLRKSLKGKLDKKNAHDPQDLIDFLLQLQNETEEPLLKKLEFLVSQVGIFLLAGFETSSSLLALILYEMARNPQIQNRLSDEIEEELKASPMLSYQKMKCLVYLDLVVKEALRLYPTASFINREHIPSTKGSSFQMKGFEHVQIPDGMPVYVSLLGLQRDPKFWSNPEAFDPQRFNFESTSLVNPLAYLPFGCGPHHCIGSRLGILQVKLALVHIFKDFQVDLCPLTLPRIEYDPKYFMLNIKGDLILKFSKRKK